MSLAALPPAHPPLSAVDAAIVSLVPRATYEKTLERLKVQRDAISDAFIRYPDPSPALYNGFIHAVWLFNRQINEVEAKILYYPEQVSETERKC